MRQNSSVNISLEDGFADIDLQSHFPGHHTGVFILIFFCKTFVNIQYQTSSLNLRF